jgi:hypothetical protein
MARRASARVTEINSSHAVYLSRPARSRSSSFGAREQLADHITTAIPPATTMAIDNASLRRRAGLSQAEPAGACRRFPSKRAIGLTARRDSPARKSSSSVSRHHRDQSPRARRCFDRRPNRAHPPPQSDGHETLPVVAEREPAGTATTCLLRTSSGRAGVDRCSPVRLWRKSGWCPASF